MLARQWQLGEFLGEDAGSPVSATFHVSTTRPSRYRAQENPADRPPLEAVMEARPVPFTIGPHRVSLDLRVAMGRRWMKLMSTYPPPFAEQDHRAVAHPGPDPTSDDDVPLIAHPGDAAGGVRQGDGRLRAVPALEGRRAPI